MGFFSWECAKTKKPVMSRYAVQNGPFDFSSRVVVLFNDGSKISGIYDGYGRVNDFEIVNVPESQWRMVIERYYAGETFDDLKINKHERGQGFFYSDEELEVIFNDEVVKQ